MYAAKQGGGAGHALYEQHMESDARAQIELQGDLRIALANRELAAGLSTQGRRRKRRVEWRRGPAAVASPEARRRAAGCASFRWPNVSA